MFITFLEQYLSRVVDIPVVSTLLAILKAYKNDTVGKPEVFC